MRALRSLDVFGLNLASHPSSSGGHGTDLATSTSFPSVGGAEPAADHPAHAIAQEHTQAMDPEVKRLSGGKVILPLMNNNNAQYYGDFLLGNPGQRFTGVFDTGSAVTWVPGTKCQSAYCGSGNRFSFAKDSPQLDKTSQIHYGTGNVDLEHGRDMLTLCDGREDPGCHGHQSHRLQLSGQEIGAASSRSAIFEGMPFDGIVGLAPSKNKGSLLNVMKANKVLPRNVFGVYLSEDPHRSGSIDFGGVEPAHIAPDSKVHWHSINNKSEWSLDMKDILVDGKPMHLCDKRPGGVCPAVVDTGSSLLTGPSQDIAPLLKKIRVDKDCGNLKSLPTISLRLIDRDGHTVDYPLAPKEYTAQTVEARASRDQEELNGFPVLGKNAGLESEQVCDPAVGVLDVNGGKWVIGDTFLRRYYSIYDDDAGAVGLVRSIHPDEAPVAVTTGDQAPEVAAASMPWWSAGGFPTEPKSSGVVVRRGRHLKWSAFL